MKIVYIMKDNCGKANYICPLMRALRQGKKETMNHTICENILFCHLGELIF